MARRGPDLRGATGDLTLQAVTKEFGSFTAVDALDLVVPRGGFFALLGPSGWVFIGSTDLTGSRPYERPVNTVFQSYALFPHLDIVGNVAFGPRRRGVKEAAAQATEALELVQIGHLADRKPGQLSGGQQ